MACTLEPLDYSKSLDCSKAQSVPVCASQDILRVFSKQSCDAHLRATLPLALFALSQVKGVAMLARAEVCAYIAELLKANGAAESRLLGRAVSQGISAARFQLPRGTAPVMRLVLELASQTEQLHSNVWLAYHFAHTRRQIKPLSLADVLPVASARTVTSTPSTKAPDERPPLTRRLPDAASPGPSTRQLLLLGCALLSTQHELGEDQERRPTNWRRSCTDNRDRVRLDTLRSHRGRL